MLLSLTLSKTVEFGDINDDCYGLGRSPYRRLCTWRSLPHNLRRLGKHRGPLMRLSALKYALFDLEP